MDVSKLDAAVRSVCPALQGIAIGDPADRTTWRLDFGPGATDAQRQAAQQAMMGYADPTVRTVFDPETLITTLFTPAEQLGFTAKPQGVLFATLIAASQSIDITSASFKADIGQAVAGGFLTQARADQVLVGTSVPQED